MTQTGYVLSNADDGTASVEVVRGSACSACHQRESCGAGVIGSCARCEKVVVKAYNTCNAAPGDRVEIASSSAKTLLIAFCVFVLPLVLAFTTYALAARLIPSDIIPYLIAAVFFVVSLFALFFGINARLSKTVTLRVTRVLPKDVTDNASGEHSK